MALIDINVTSTEGSQEKLYQIGTLQINRPRRTSDLQTRVYYFKNTTGSTIAANSVIDFGNIEPCVIEFTRLQCTAWGTSRTLDVGTGVVVDADTVDGIVDSIIDGADVSAATQTIIHPADGTAEKGGLEITANSRVVGTVLGGTLPNNGEVSLTVVYRPSLNLL